MLAFGLVLSALGIGLFCWLIFELAVYALPFFTAVTVGMMAFHSGAGLVGSLFAGIATAALALTLGQFAMAVSRSMILRIVVAAVFAVPAAVVGYQVTHGLAQIGRPSPPWQEVLACFGALFVGATAWVRINVFAQPRSGPGRASSESQPVIASTIREG